MIKNKKIYIKFILLASVEIETSIFLPSIYLVVLARRIVSIPRALCVPRGVYATIFRTTKASKKASERQPSLISRYFTSFLHWFLFMLLLLCFIITEYFSPTLLTSIKLQNDERLPRLWLLLSCLEIFINLYSAFQ